MTMRDKLCGMFIALLMLPAGAAAADEVPTHTNNPYLNYMIAHVDDLLAATPDARRNVVRKDVYAHWLPQNEWIHAEFANLLLMGAYLYTQPESPWQGSPKMLAFCQLHVDALLEAAVDDRWFHLDPRMGDRNIDRFTGVSFFDAYQLLEKHLSDDQQQRVRKLAEGLMHNQYHEYGSGSAQRENIPGGRRLYPNMDACYALLMAHGYRITGNERYLNEARRFIGQLDRAQFEDGAWTYIGGSNECASYHGLDLLALARVADLLDDDNARRQLDKSVPYYPMTLTPDGIAEYHTDVWWKHMWNPQTSFGPDTIASLSGNSENRYFGDMLREQTLGRATDALLGKDIFVMNTDGFNLVTSARCWRDVIPQAPPVPRVFHDRNIDGPRAHLDRWSWAATARFAGDTLVGATVRSEQGQPLCALMAVSPEIAYRHEEQAELGNHRFALATTPRDVPSTTTIDTVNQSATFEAQYKLAAYRMFWGAEPFPQEWECTQKWTLGPTSMTGHIELKSLKDQHSAPPLVRIRFGIEQELEDLGGGLFQYGPLQMQVSSDDFVQHAARPCNPMPSRRLLNAVELVLSTTQGMNSADYTAGQTLRLEVTVQVDADYSAADLAVTAGKQASR